MKLSICVGSSCHLKGSHAVITRIQELIKDYKLNNDLELCASFCLGRCAPGVSMTLDDELIDGANGETIDEIYKTIILPKLGK